MKRAARPALVAASLFALALLVQTGPAAAASGDAAAPSRLGAASTSTRTIVDMVGRRVHVPGTIRKVYCTSPVGTILVYTLAPEKLAGWNYPLTAAEREYIAAPFRDLPVLGGWFGKGNSANVEEIIAAQPDAILSMGTTDPLSITQSERLQAQSGIPVIVMSGALARLDDAYIFAGELLGARERASRLAAYCRSAVAEARSIAATIPPAARVRVYYAEGPRGLETDPAGSYHTELLDLVGAINVAGAAPASPQGQVAVSFEQLIAWDPDVIIIGYNYGQRSGLQLDRLAADPTWRQLRAVRQRRVYETPQVPFNWFDRPPSVNRIIGIRWLGQLLYPDRYRRDLRRDVRDFYETFYHVTLTDEQIAHLLQRAMPPDWDAAGGI
jgi:iron complex transport system substrate-binding protein